MDKLSLRVLKYIAHKQDDVSSKDIATVFGSASKKSLAYLEHEEFIKSGQTIIGINPSMKPVFSSNEIYGVTSKGLAFLEEKPGADFDRWLTRFCAIWGAITGTAAIIAEIVLHFL